VTANLNFYLVLQFDITSSKTKHHYPTLWWSH